LRGNFTEDLIWLEKNYAKPKVHNILAILLTNALHIDNHPLYCGPKTTFV